MQAESDKPRIELEINGRSWRQVSSLEDSSPRDRHFTVAIDGDQAVLSFGDGIHGARPPSHAHQVRLPYQPGTGYTHVALQMGRARPAGDMDEQPGESRLFGLYRAVVLDNFDPLGQMRLKIQAPEALGLAPAWALPCLPPGPCGLPLTGAHVWVMFEHGDPAYPVWIGVMVA